MSKVNKMYEAPYLEVADVQVESGIAVSPGDDYYGGWGDAGQDSDYIDPDFDL